MFSICHNYWSSLFLLYNLTEGSSDFELKTYYGKTDDKKGHASLNFTSIIHFSSASQWYSFTACFWAKSSHPVPASDGLTIRYLSYLNATGGLVFRIYYKADKDLLILTGWKSKTYEKNTLLKVYLYFCFGLHTSPSLFLYSLQEAEK